MSETRKSARENKGIPPQRYAMPDSPQPTTAPKQQQPSAIRSQTENLPQPSDPARLVKEMQREFQKQIATLQNVIVSQNEQNKSSVDSLRNEIYAIARTVTTNRNNESNTNPTQSNDAVTQQQPNGVQANSANAQPVAAISGESFSNLSSNFHSCPPAKAKKIYPLPKFGGQPEDWQAFIEDFRITTVEFEYSDLHNIIRIRESLYGRARDTVESLLTTSKNVNAIIEVLAETFGRPELLIKSQIEKVRFIPNKPEGKLEPLINFANKVNNMATFLKSVQGEHHLANPSLLSELIIKLPISKQMQWAEKCLSLERSSNVGDFSAWLNTLRKLANIVADSLPSTSSAASRRSQEFVPNAHPPRGSKISFLSVVQSKCLICQGDCATINACPQFNSLTVDNRWKKVKELRICFSCLKPKHQMSKCYLKKRCGINNCSRLHNSLLHPDDIHHDRQANLQQPAEVTHDRINCHADMKTDGVLFQIIPIKLYHDNKEISIYAMVDDGADATMLDWNVAHELGLKGNKDSLQLQWLNGVSSHEPTEIVEFMISGIETNSQKYLMSKVFLSRKLNLPVQSSLKESVIQKHSHLKGVPTYEYKNVHPKMIISLSHAFLTTPLDVPRASSVPGPIAVETRLGWIIYGPIGGAASTTKRLFQAKLITENNQEQELQEIMRKYFEVESCGVKLDAKPVISKQDELAINIMTSTTRYLSGRYECGLLWKSDFITFPDSYNTALRRLELVEKKFRFNGQYAKQYCAKIDDYIAKGYARVLSLEEQRNYSPKTYFLPHFGVSNPNKIGIRIVFDAAAKVKDVSLNSALLSGPDMNQSLLAILFKFRQCPIAICGDIREMFLQIVTRKDDQDSLRFLWRDGNPANPLRQYVMTRMIFGAKCSPTIAQHIKNTNAERFRQKYSRAVQAITERHYVDDYVDCFQSESEALKTVCEVIKIHAAAGFELRNILSNSEFVNRSCGNSPSTAIDISADKSERILGMQWMPHTDNFVFELKFHRVPKEILYLQRKPTKREVLSTVMSVFDPYGLLANLTIGAKILMQSLWRHNLGWNDVVPDELNGKWAAWIGQLSKVKDFHVPRCYFKDFIHIKKELHIFCDASEVAMATVAYWRLETVKGIKLSFVAGKTNCAPIKYQTIPKLELQSAVFAVRLCKCIMKHHDVQPSGVTFWTDSHTVIRWLKSDARRYKQFVANRVSEILESATVKDWNWVPGELNPADDGTRAISAYNPDGRWKNGPDFLLNPKKEWPTEPNGHRPDRSAEELRSKHSIFIARNVSIPIYDIKRFSSYARLKRTIGWVFRYTRNLKKTVSQQPRGCGELSVTEEQLAENFLCRNIQQIDFAREYNRLLNGENVEACSELRTLNPYLDENGVIRIKGRIDNAPFISFAARRPCILPKSSQLTRLIVEFYHRKYKHINTQTVINEIRMKFWIPSIRVLVHSVESRCYRCKMLKSVPNQPIMGLLPKDRVTAFVRPFTYTGLDYFGPIEVTVRRRKEKRWVAIFTCLTVRAIHLEIATDASSDACLLCIRNFINRRGVPLQIRSDNGTNFVGLAKELGNETQFLDHNAMTAGLTPLGIKWKFNTPSNPSEGGAWERLVRSVKRALYAMLKEQAPRIETLYGLLVESENMINSRPLTHMPVTPDQPEPLTPNHFLLGGPNSTQTPAPYEGRLCALRKQWRVLQNLKNGMWKRWIAEYLPDLTRRTKWCRFSKPISTGCLVLICETDLPRSKWKRGRVMKVYLGPDAVARSAEVQTNSGIFRRPVSKLAILDVDEKSGESPHPESIHGGGDVNNGNA